MLGGFNPLTVDIFGSTVMGVDWRKLKMLVGGEQLTKYRIGPVDAWRYEVHSSVKRNFDEAMFHFRLPSGWIGHAELEPVESASLDAI
jgi:hypothetical protein